MRKPVPIQVGNWIALPRKGKYKLHGWTSENRTAQFTLHETGLNKWRVCGIALTGERHRYRFFAANLDEAIAVSERCLGYEKQNDTDTSIPDVFSRWIETLTCRPSTKKGYADSIKLFLDYCDSRSLYWWADLRLEHVQAYYQTVRAQAYDTARLRMLPIKAASRWAAINWPEFINFAAGLVMLKPQRTTFVLDEREALTFEEVAKVLMARLEDYRFVQGIALQSLAGLRVTEMLRLTWDNIDGDVITIHGEVKNAASVRRIPISWHTAEILRRSRVDNRVIDAYANHNNYYHAVRGVLKEHGFDIPPKNLRKTLPTEFKRRGWDGYILERYVGHAAKTIMDRHYVAIGQAELEVFFREQVVARIDEIMREYLDFGHEKGTVDKVVRLR